MRRFHATSTCDPVKRQEQFEKRQRNPNAHEPRKPKPFPPTGKDRKFPLSSYSDKHCGHCKTEDVDPMFALHNPNRCYRRPGGECDQAKAKTKAARDRVVRKEVQRMRNARENPQHRTTTLNTRSRQGYRQHPSRTRSEHCSPKSNRRPHCGPCHKTASENHALGQQTSCQEQELQ